MAPSRRSLLRGALALALYTAWALVYLRPIWRTYADHLAPDRVDPLLNLYILKWGAHQIRLGLPDLWNASFFYPTRGTLAFSDHLLGPALQMVLLTPFLPDAVAAYNVLFFTSFVLSASTAAWVLRRAGCSLPAALLGGGMWAFSPFRLMHANHLQILLAQWIPLVLWHFDRLLAERTVRRALLFLGFYLLHVSGGCYLAYMIHVPLLVLALNRLATPERREILSPASLRVLVPAGTLALAAAAAVFLPYARISSHLALARDPEEILRNGATLASYVSPSPRLVTGQALVQRVDVLHEGWWKGALLRNENSLGAGLVTTLAALYGLLGFWHRYRERPPSPLGRGRRLALALLAAVALLAFAGGEMLTLRRGRSVALPLGFELSVGLPLGAVFLAATLLAVALRRRWTGGWPLRFGGMDRWERGLLLSGAVCFLLTFPLVYLALMRVLPGLDGMRVPARFYAFVSLTLAALAARGLDALAGRFGSRRSRTLLWTAAGLLFFLDLLPRPLHWARVPPEREFPEVYRWVAARPEVQVLAELPLRPQGDTEAMYYSTLHWKPIANGFSGYLPPTYLEMIRLARLLPEREGLDLLRGLGVTHLLVRPGELAPRWRRRRDPEFGHRLLRGWEHRYLGKGVERVHVSGPVRVYAITSSVESSSRPKREGRWKSGGEVRVGDQQLSSGRPPRGRSTR